MKQMAISFILILCLSYCVVIECDQLSKAQYTEGLLVAMEESVRHALTLLGNQTEEEISSDEGLYASFLQDLMLQMGNQASYEVYVYERNYSRGILDVETIMHVKLPSGRNWSVSCRRRGKLEAS